MALAKLPGRPTPVCVECVTAPTAYARGGFAVHISCAPGLRGYDDILALYTRVPSSTAYRCSFHPEISAFHGVGGASGLQFTNDLYVLAYGGTSCVDGTGLMTEISAGVDLSDTIVCITVRGR